MDDLKARARELLAAELRRAERHYTADEILTEEYGHTGDMAVALRAIEAAMQEGEWLGIESAPKDGTRILVYREGQQYVAKFSTQWKRWIVPTERIPGEPDPAYEIDQVGEGAYIIARGPTHWRPLPAPPEAKG